MALSSLLAVDEALVPPQFQVGSHCSQHLRHVLLLQTLETRNLSSHLHVRDDRPKRVKQEKQVWIFELLLSYSINDGRLVACVLREERLPFVFRRLESHPQRLDARSHVVCASIVVVALLLQLKHI